MSSANGPDAPKEADAIWQRAVTWEHGANRALSDTSRIAVLAEADASSGQSGQMGLYLTHWHHHELVEPFLRAMGAQGQYRAWRSYMDRTCGEISIRFQVTTIW